MDLILWRHAEAEDGIHDLSRQLTAKGEKQANKMAAFLHPRLPHGTRILVSPAMRTRQTAQALTQDFAIEAAIAPGASSRDILEAAHWGEDDGCALIVGHQPVLGEVAALLLSGKEEYWSIKKGAVWWLSHRQREHVFETTLRLVIAPDLL